MATETDAEREGLATEIKSAYLKWNFDTMIYRVPEEAVFEAGYRAALARTPAEGEPE